METRREDAPGAVLRQGEVGKISFFLLKIGIRE
jgi:hypothetical protein